jgi:hypothetical protein
MALLRERKIVLLAGVGIWGFEFVRFFFAWSPRVLLLMVAAWFLHLCHYLDQG